MAGENDTQAGLKGLEYSEDYRTGYDDILDDLLRPSLRRATNYWRAVGYFSSSALESFGSPLGEFVRNGGAIRLVTSVELREQDLAAVSAGADKREICEARIEQIIEEQFSDGVGDGVARLCALLDLGRLEMKIAVPKKGTGIYHEKIGLFFDGTSDFVAFSGSSNESRNAFENNRECVDVFPSWESPSRASRKKAHFEQLWKAEDDGVYVYSLPEAAKRKLLRISHTPARPKPAEPLKNRWRHQDEAVTSFMKSERGILNLATGTGKTRTALRIMSALFEEGTIRTAVITMDGLDLLQQWYGELLALKPKLPKGVRLFRDYGAWKDVQGFSLSPENSILLVSRAGGTVRDPLVSALSRLTPSLAGRTMLIHDEVHRLGSPNNRLRLDGRSGNLRFRLGLSATPDREYDADGNTFIGSHIGPELARFGLEDAIKRGILSPFDYHPLPYELTADDRSKVRDVYRLQAARQAAGEPMSQEQVWTAIANVYKTSEAKLPVFAEFIAGHPDLLRRCIIFVETQQYGEQVLDIVHRHRPDFHTYFSGEDSETLKSFARGDFECLLTCHRVSEGIDIRSLNSVILFSSSKARLETIQRMGRCLRSNPANPGKTASVVDFIRTSDGDEPNTDEERAAWLSELSTLRAEE